jgi:hypothetical protein
MVPDAHPDVGFGRGLKQDQLVASDARAAVGQRARQALADFQRLLASVKNREIIAEAMHLVELPKHRGAT